MATEKTLKTRIVQKIDDLNSWKSSTLPLKKGEIALATTSINGKNIVLAKIGVDDVKTWSQIPEYNFYAPAADVSPWAKSTAVKFIENGADHQLVFGNVTENGEFITVATVDAKMFVTHTELTSALNTALNGITQIAAGDELEAETVGNVKTINHKEKLDASSTKVTSSNANKTFTANHTDSSVTITVPKLEVNEFGHVTKLTEEQVKLQSTKLEIPDVTITATDDNIVDLTASASGYAITIDAKHKKYHTTDPDAVGAVKDEAIIADGNEVKFLVPNIDVDEYGHVEGVGEHEISITIPEIPDLAVIKGTNTPSPTGETIEVVTTMSESPSEHKITYTTADMPTKKYVDSALETLKGELEDDIDNLHVNITDKTLQDDTSKGYVYAVTNLVEDNNGAHNIVPTYTKIATFEQVEKLAIGSVDYLGTVSTTDKLTEYAARASHGDFARVIIDDAKSDNPFKAAYCTGDLLIYNKPDIGDPTWDLIHGELDQDTWNANDTNVAGYVAAPGTGKSGYVWKVGSDNKPAWLPDANDDTNTNSTYDISVAEVSSETAEVTFVEKIKDEITGTVTNGETEKIKIRAAGDNTLEVDATNKLITITGTDEKVTSAANHYEPTKDATKTIDLDAAANTTATWGTTSMVTGVTVERDSKGHVTNVTLDSIKMPANPDTNTTYDLSAKNGGTNIADIDLTAGGSGSGTDTVKLKGTGAISITTDAANNTITIDKPRINLYSDTFNSTNTSGIKLDVKEGEYGPSVLVYNGDRIRLSESSEAGTIYIEPEVTKAYVKTIGNEVRFYDDFEEDPTSMMESSTPTSTLKFEANTGLKITNNANIANANATLTFGFDDDVEFIFDCGDSKAR